MTTPPLNNGELQSVVGAPASAGRPALSPDAQKVLETLSELARRQPQQVTAILNRIEVQLPNPSSRMLPDPDQLGKLDVVLPGFAERYLVMSEKEQSHRHSWEDKHGQRGFLIALFAQFTALLLGLSFIIGAVWAAYMGRQFVGVALGGSGIAVIIKAALSNPYLRNNSSSQQTQNASSANLKQKKAPTSKAKSGKR